MNVSLRFSIYQPVRNINMGAKFNEKIAYCLRQSNKEIYFYEHADFILKLIELIITKKFLSVFLGKQWLDNHCFSRKTDKNVFIIVISTDQPKKNSRVT